MSSHNAERDDNDDQHADGSQVRPYQLARPVLPVANLERGVAWYSYSPQESEQVS